MLHWKIEGEKTEQGLSIYPLSDWSNSRGGVFRWNKSIFWFRYSPHTTKWFVSKQVFD